jgi:hypothetical protein
MCGKLARGLAITVGLVGAAALVAPAAQASTPATLSATVNCDSPGASFAECFVTINGGVAPYAVRWSVSDSTSTTVVFRCAPADWSTARATVTDHAGNHVSASGDFICLTGKP